MSINLSITQFNALSAEDKRRAIIEGERKIAKHSSPHLIVRKAFSLPEDIIIEIFKFLNKNDLCNTASVNHCFREISLMNNEYYYTLECVRVDKCVNLGIRQENRIPFEKSKSESTSKSLRGEKENKKDDSTPTLLLSKEIKCNSLLESIIKKQTLNFTISSNGELEFYDPKDSSLFHKTTFTEISKGLVKKIHSVQQIGNIICPKCTVRASSLEYGIENDFIYYINLNKYLDRIFSPVECSELQTNFDALPVSGFRYLDDPKMHIFDHPFEDENGLENLLFSETKIYIIESQLIICGNQEIHLFEINKNEKLQSKWSFKLESPYGVQINLDSLVIDKRILFFTSNVSFRKHCGKVSLAGYLNVMNLKDGNMIYYDYFLEPYRQFFKPIITVIHNDIVACVIDLNTVLFLHKLNKDYSHWGILTSKLFDKLTVNGEIKNIRFTDNADQLIIKVIYQTANSFFRRTKLKELTLSSDSLELQVPNQRRKSPFKLGCSSV